MAAKQKTGLMTDEVKELLFPLHRPTDLHGLNGVMDKPSSITTKELIHKPNYLVVRKEIKKQVPVINLNVQEEEPTTEPSPSSEMLFEEVTEEVFAYYKVNIDKDQLQSNKKFVDFVRLPTILWRGVLMLAGKNYYSISRKDILKGRFYVGNKIDAVVLFPPDTSGATDTDSNVTASFSVVEPGLIQEAELAFSEQITALHGAPDTEEEW